MLDKEKVISILETVDFNKSILEMIRNTDKLDFFVKDFLIDSSALETWSYYGSRNFSNKIVANAFITHVTWD